MSSLSTIVDLGGTIMPFLRYPEPEYTSWSAFNPSIVKTDDGNFKMLIRSSNYFLDEETGQTKLIVGKDIASRLWLADVESGSLALSNLKEVSYLYPDSLIVKRGAEDARLFQRNGGWFFTAVLLEPPSMMVARMGLFSLDIDTGTATFLYILEGPDSRRPEKNWMVPDQPSEYFDFIYSTELVSKNGKFLSVVPKVKTEDLRGSSNLLKQEDGTYLAVTHTVRINITYEWDSRFFANVQKHERVYDHYFAIYSEKGALLSLSEPFYFKNRGVEFCSGMAEDGENLVLTWGAKDLFAVFSVIPKKNVMNLIPKY